ncbi:Acetylornithine deacetylase/Succinyl-diaminopimelate desuccinylase [Paraburkholderia caribensis]|uniref:M20 family metallopeptidase n=1 Tax=Paraburkholderia caribensis TaxID=75105 RepID=UPI001CAEB32E|nr:M20 family metallopeptidase [Paraburkholderia caribensis]CAG9219658.1 Acetylornithine deacetylase/Succinyl-diaminopimelate desuccinylase [Paraburkholderia caribensis]
MALEVDPTNKVASATADPQARDAALVHAADFFDRGDFRESLATRVIHMTESQAGSSRDAIQTYLDDEIAVPLHAMGFETLVLENPERADLPLLVGTRHESDESPTVLIYGHADVVKGDDAKWRKGLSPWTLVVEGNRWYGRGTADNKGQHSINLAALASVLHTRGGRLGFNCKVLIESGEECGSPGLERVCAEHAGLLAADVLIASDGPRVSAERPTIFLGSRGIVRVELSLNLRDAAHHSGNWGGLLSNPAVILAAAINLIIDKDGRILIDSMRPPAIPDTVRQALALIEIGGSTGDPVIDQAWGEPGLTPSERVIGWNAFEVLAMQSGNPSNPVGAIPPNAIAHCHLRYVVGTPVVEIEGELRRVFDAHGLTSVNVAVKQGTPATRLDPASPWARLAAQSITTSTGKQTAVLPNLGGTIPNHVFADVLQLPTVWIPHSYPACAQHAPNEHLLGDVAREGLQLMAGLFWDLGDVNKEALLSSATLTTN